MYLVPNKARREGRQGGWPRMLKSLGEGRRICRREDVRVWRAGCKEGSRNEEIWG